MFQCSNDLFILFDWIEILSYSVLCPLLFSIVLFILLSTWIDISNGDFDCRWVKIILNSCFWKRILSEKFELKSVKITAIEYGEIVG